MNDIPCQVTTKLREKIFDLWNRNCEGGDLGADLYECGYILATSDHHKICVVDESGEVYSLIEVIRGETTSNILHRLGITDLNRLLTVEQAKWLQHSHMQEEKSVPNNNPVPERNVGLYFHIDTNRINARGNLSYMNQIERWHRDDVISLDMSEVAYDEALSGNNMQRAEKADANIFIRANDVFGGECKKKIGKIVFDSTNLTENQKRDVEILFCARMAGAILITNDGASKLQPGGILGHAKELAYLGIKVMTDEVAVQKVRDRIALRDKTARSISRDTGLPFPSWVGQD